MLLYKKGRQPNKYEMTINWQFKNLKSPETTMQIPMRELFIPRDFGLTEAVVRIH